MTAAGFVGRDEEVASIEAFLERVRLGPAALVVSGDPGIGKTALWDLALRRARERGFSIFCYRGVEAEAGLTFAALSDLLADVLEESLRLLSAPRRRALEVALLLADPAGRPPDRLAIGLAVGDILRAQAASAPIIVAVDDLQWLDSSSWAVLQLALRRLRREPVGFLATARRNPGGPFALDARSLFPHAPVDRLVLPPLSVGAAYRLLAAQLGLAPSRPELVRLHELTDGNPLYLLEAGRELSRTRASPAPGRQLPLPRDLTELLAERLGRLPTSVREVLLTVAASQRATVEVLEAAHASSDEVGRALGTASDAGLIEIGASRVRFVHPLLASVCYRNASLRRRRATHRQLAAVLSDDEERARHLALAADAPDAAVASELDRAAKHAAARGATAAAAELLELAAGATPCEAQAESRRRLLGAATSHRLSGDRPRAARILERLLADAPSGSERADVLFALAQGRRGDLPSIAKLCEEALAEAVGDDRRSAQILGFLSWMRLIEGDVGGALAAAREGLQSAERVGAPALLALAIARVAMAETWALDITPGLVERGVVLEEGLDRPLEFHESPTIALARRLISLCDLERARSLLEDAERKAAAHGDEGTRGHVLFHLILLEWFAGRWARAVAHAAAALDLGDQLGDEQYRGMVLHARALVDAHLGRVDAARAAAEEAAGSAEAVSDAIFPIWNAGVLGHVELGLGNLEAAARHLRSLPERLLALGWHDPSDSVWPDAIEALVGIGELEEARAYLDRFEALAQRSGSPWPIAGAARCRGLLATAEGDSDAAFAAFDSALASHERMEGAFERGRTLLALGAARRRARQKRAARDALEKAREIFDQQGARCWERRASEELGRISGRRPTSAKLTATEERVASLAAGGLANKEVASTLFMSVHTVEAHLTRVYRKLGVRSRTELARHASISPETAPKM